MSAVSRREAFSLVEVVLALGIAIFVLISLTGLLGAAHNAGAESAKTIDAAGVASQIINRWRTVVEWNASHTNPAVAPASFPLPATIPTVGGEVSATSSIYIDNEGMVASSAQDGAFRLSYRVSRESAFPQTLQVHLQLSWPPQAPITNASRYDAVSTALLREVQ